MTDMHGHASHPAIATRPKRAGGHLRHVVAMIAEGKACRDRATRLHAVAPVVAEAKRAVIHDQIEQCLTKGHGREMAEFKASTSLS